MKKIPLLYAALFILLSVFSYVFVDGGLAHTSFVSWYVAHRQTAGIIYGGFVLSLWAVYALVLKEKNFRLSPASVIVLLAILLLSFPAFSYDIFNYIATARVAFHYGENPWLVMPIEIAGEPMLAYTRAANKFALYGPSWILMTAIPYFFGLGNIWATIIAMKAMVAAFYLGIAWLIYKLTKRWEDVWYFALNPLVLIEVLVSGHNDVFMMFLAIGALMVAARHRIASWALWALSVMVKGATVVLAPVLFMKDPLSQRSLRISYWLLFAVFLLSPFREEMYPWYALWLVPFAAILTKDRFIRGFTLALTLGLSFRHLHYIATAEYGGYGPLYRTVVTALPVCIFLAWHTLKKK